MTHPDTRLPPTAHVGHARVQVPDLREAQSFYGELLGLRPVVQADAAIAYSASGQAPVLLEVIERPGAPPKPPRTTGLYHLALLMPSRADLGRLFRRLLDVSWPFQGFSDHGVSEALYLADPFGNGLELYADRPRERWLWRDGQIAMTTEPLDLDDLLRAGAGQNWQGMPAEATLGHVHLHVSDLARAEGFYHGVLGFDVTQRTGIGALFLSAGGYHHHLGVNIWAGRGAPPPPPESVGLLSFALRVPGRAPWEALRERAIAAGLPIEQAPNVRSELAFLLHDADSNAVVVVCVT